MTGKCDRAGRFWAGTVLTPLNMADEKEQWVGKLWRLEPSGESVVTSQAIDKSTIALCDLIDCLWFQEVLHNIKCSQGPSWSPDNKIMYYHDSSGGGIQAYDYDHATGAISNQRTFADDMDLAPGERGGPDGFTVDSEGFVWAAVWGASKVVRIDPSTGKVVAAVTCPGLEASGGRASSCMFGGEDLLTLMSSQLAHKTLRSWQRSRYHRRQEGFILSTCRRDSLPGCRKHHSRDRPIRSELDWV